LLKHDFKVSLSQYAAPKLDNPENGRGYPTPSRKDSTKFGSAIPGHLRTNSHKSGKHLQNIGTEHLLLTLAPEIIPSAVRVYKVGSRTRAGTFFGVSSNTILDISCNLVLLDKTLDVFRFAHLSIREYFEKFPEFFPEASHSIVAMSCMRHIDTA
jgi:hypothetical protein